ncbi:hypothetical protein G6F50_018154 [Rhizopus delemar]|nr:hypothetical protein G6F50_018154 [Rhizopus delemar]
MSLDLTINYVDADVESLNPHWTDHALLTLVLKPDLPTPSGPGLWRANPTYVTHRNFRNKFAQMLTKLYD